MDQKVFSQQTAVPVNYSRFGNVSLHPIILGEDEYCLTDS
jgi:hypothetical protein